MSESLILDLSAVRRADVGRVGGKNASLGEMIGELSGAGIRVPGGFATTADAYWQFIDHNALRGPIADLTGSLSLDRTGDLERVAAALRALILDAPWPPTLAAAIRAAYEVLGADTPVAVRSSATAEDLPEASFAGQQESFLNVCGSQALLDSCRRCYASLFTERAIAYRETQGFAHLDIALSVGVQRMVRADRGCAGVMFSIDTESGFPREVLITGNWGLGETVVQGSVDPDEYRVFKPLLERRELRPIVERKLGRKEEKMVYAADGGTQLVHSTAEERAAAVLGEAQVLQLARWAAAIEAHYGCPMDMEWARDGDSSELYIVQARPETVQATRSAAALKTYALRERGELLVTGLSIGDAIAAGAVCRLDSAADIDRFVTGAVLVTAMTDPDWVPIMKRAAALVTDHGGRTSHAAIVSRELGLPAVVGAGDATAVLADGRELTVSCAEGDEGYVYDGRGEILVTEIDLDALPATRTQVMLNLADPAAAMHWWRLPADGVGLARMEFIINNQISCHPMALVHPERVSDPAARQRIAALTAGWDDPCEFFVDRLARGIARIASTSWPQPVIVRMSDFKTNEYAELIGGAGFEPREANPMIGWRGASRYYSPDYREGFALECRAIRRARETLGLDNVVVMIPFCRTPEEADRVLAEMAANGLARGEKGLEVYVMAEIPSNIVLADAFAERFDGFSIGSNDLTQLTLGVDRDSDRLASLFDDTHEALRRSIRHLVEVAHGYGRKVGLCGQAPSDHPAFARFLVAAGIDSMSVNPDSFAAVKRQVAEAEADAAGGR